MKHAPLAIFLASGVLAAAATEAQDKKIEAPRPGPEVTKLAYFAGTWKSEGEIKPNPFLPAGKFSTTDSCEWFSGGFHVVCRSTGKGPAGPMQGLGILAWDAEEKAYTYTGIDNGGWSEDARGQAEGNTWTYKSEAKMAGKTHHHRYTMVTSPDSYTFKYESSEDGNRWMTVMEGKTTKTAAPSPSTQEKPVPPAKPGPEVAKLGFFRGTWSHVADARPNSLMPAGRYTWTEKCDWFPGGFQLICYTAGKSPMGPTLSMGILAWRPEEKAYTYRGIDNAGSSVASQGTVAGNNWTWTAREKANGQAFHGRYSIRAAETSYTFRYETSADGRSWSPVMEGKAIRPPKRVKPERELQRERERERERERKETPGKG